MSNYSYQKKTYDNLIELAKNNDIKAIETLIRLEQRHIYAIFAHLADKKEDIADLTQETLLKMAKNICNLRDTSHFRHWLNKIISNVFYDYTKKKLKYPLETGDEIINEIKDKSYSEPGEKCIFAEIEVIVKHALMSLPKNLRLSIVLREYEGLSYEDISKVMNTTIGTVKSRISRARLKLREELAEFI